MELKPFRVETNYKVSIAYRSSCDNRGITSLPTRTLRKFRHGAKARHFPEVTNSLPNGERIFSELPIIGSGIVRLLQMLRSRGYGVVLLEILITLLGSRNLGNEGWMLRCGACNCVFDLDMGSVFDHWLKRRRTVSARNRRLRLRGARLLFLCLVH